MTKAYKEERELREEKEKQEAQKELQYQEAMANVLRNMYWQKRAEEMEAERRSTASSVQDEDEVQEEDDGAIRSLISETIGDVVSPGGIMWTRPPGLEIEEGPPGLYCMDVNKPKTVEVCLAKNG